MKYLAKQKAGTLDEDRKYHAGNLMNLLDHQDPRTKGSSERIVGDIGLNPDDLRSNPDVGKQILEDRLKSK